MSCVFLKSYRHFYRIYFKLSDFHSHSYHLGHNFETLLRLVTATQKNFIAIQKNVTALFLVENCHGYFFLSWLVFENCQEYSKCHGKKH